MYIPKKPQAIVYVSNTGSTKEYALMAGEATGLPVYDFEEAKKELMFGDDIAFFSWIKAGKLVDHKMISSKFEVVSICAVGMGSSSDQINSIRKNNKIDSALPMFYLQGGFDMTKLSGTNKLMMNLAKRFAGNRVKKKADPTPEEKQMLELLENGRTFVDEKNLEAFYSWMNEDLA